MRLIDADALVQRYKEHKELLAKNREKNQEKINFLHALTLDVKRAKKIEAEPVRYGRWKAEIITDALGCKRYFYACSVCGKKSDDWYDYCPNCGAKMDGGEE